MTDRPRLIGLLAWFDERPDFLRAAIASLEGHVDHLVAADGGYGIFPGAQPHSDDSQARAIIRACRKADIALSLHVPTALWPTEMDKRTFLFRAGELVSGPADWYFVIDADDVCTRWPADLHEQLQTTELDVAEASFSEPHPNADTQQFDLRCLFRAIRGLRVEVNHYTYLDGDRTLWGREHEVPCLDLTDSMEVEHRTHFRPKTRKDRAKAYYRERDELLVEADACRFCAQPGIKEVPFDWQPHADGPNGVRQLSAIWAWTCADCESIAKELNDQAVRGYGLDPKTIQVTYKKTKKVCAPS